MARICRKSWEEQLREIDVQLEKLQEKIDSLNQNRKDLLQKKKEAETQTLYNFLQSSHLSVDEAVAILSERQESVKTA